MIDLSFTKELNELKIEGVALNKEKLELQKQAQLMDQRAKEFTAKLASFVEKHFGLKGEVSIMELISRSYEKARGLN